jgi:hypothetical protein
MNKKAKENNIGMILIILIILGAGFYFFIYEEGIHNPFQSAKCSYSSLSCTTRADVNKVDQEFSKGICTAAEARACAAVWEKT